MGRCRRTESAGRHNPSPGRKSWVGVVGGRSPVERHTGSDVIGAEVPSLKGLGDLMTCVPSAEPALSAVEGCWATIVTPFGLRIAGSHPLAKSGREGWGT